MVGALHALPVFFYYLKVVHNTHSVVYFEKVAALPAQKLKLSKSAVFFMLKTMVIGDISKNFGKCPKMA